MYATGAAILIAHADPGGGDEDDHDGMRSNAKSGGYCAAKTTPLIKTLALRMPQRPLRPAAPVR